MPDYGNDFLDAWSDDDHRDTRDEASRPVYRQFRMAAVSSTRRRNLIVPEHGRLDLLTEWGGRFAPGGSRSPGGVRAGAAARRHRAWLVAENHVALFRFQSGLSAPRLAIEGFLSRKRRSRTSTDLSSRQKHSARLFDDARHSPRTSSAWHGNLSPWKYDSPRSPVGT